MYQANALFSASPRPEEAGAIPTSLVWQQGDCLSSFAEVNNKIKLIVMPVCGEESVASGMIYLFFS